MPTSAQPKTYSLFAKILHWGFVAIFIYGVIKQVGNVEDLEDAALLRFEIIFAVGFLLLLLIRYFYMKTTQTSSLPEDTPKSHRMAAKLVHFGLYGSMALIAFSGLVIGILYAQGIKSGFVMDITIGIHEVSLTLIYLLVAIHVAASIYHRLLKDGVWSSMVPIWTEKSK